MNYDPISKISLVEASLSIPSAAACISPSTLESASHCKHIGEVLSWNIDAKCSKSIKDTVPKIHMNLAHAQPVCSHIVFT